MPQMPASYQRWLAGCSFHALSWPMKPWSRDLLMSVFAAQCSSLILDTSLVP